MNDNLQRTLRTIGIVIELQARDLIAHGHPNPSKFVPVVVLQSPHGLKLAAINSLVKSKHLTQRSSDGHGPEVAITSQLDESERGQLAQAESQSSGSGKGSEVRRQAAIKANATRKANKAKAAAEVSQQAMVAAQPKSCHLCGCDKQTRYERAHVRSNAMIPVEYPIEGRYCDTCESGLLSGEFAAIGVAYELKNHRNGWAFSCHPDMRELLVQHRMQVADGSINLPPFMPRVSSEAGMAFESCLKAHKKANAKQPVKQLVEVEPSAEPAAEVTEQQQAA